MQISVSLYFLDGRPVHGCIEKCLKSKHNIFQWQILQVVRGGSVESLLESKLFRLYGEFSKIAGKMVKLNPLSKVEFIF